MRAPEFWTGDGALPWLLSPLGAGVDLAGRWRRALVRPVRAPVPVICVGNLVAGGAGKTPVALSLLAACASRGAAAHGLCRGYGGSEAGPLRVDPARHDAARVGDEALLLAAAAPTWIARDRIAGARAAAAAGAAVLVMDDGFQNPALAKDLSLLVVDGDYGFGNGRVMPAGPLRERVAAGLARADALVVLDPGRRDVLAGLALRVPVLRARLVPAAGAEPLGGQRVFAFAGIGRPEKFFATVNALGAVLAGCRDFPDHHPYRVDEIEAILERAASLDAIPVTTEKDAVRLSPAVRARVRVLRVTVEWADPRAMAELLNRVAPRQITGDRP